MLSPLLLLLPAAPTVQRDPLPALQPADVFELEWAADPRISPDGERVAYLRGSMDVRSDRRRSSLWIVNVATRDHRPVAREAREAGGDPSWPRWSPDGGRLAWVWSAEGSSQIRVRWMDTGQSAVLARLEHDPADLTWSPDGRWIAFTAFVPAKPDVWIEMPPRPEGAHWADAPRAIEAVRYRADGRGYLEDGHRQVFLLSADGGTPRQLTRADYDCTQPCWLQDGSGLVFSANDDPDAEPENSDLYRVELASGEVTQLTDRFGPDGSPSVAPDGERLAYLGFDDAMRSFEPRVLSVMELASRASRPLTAALDRDIGAVAWSGDGQSLFVSYSDHGNGKLARVGLDGSLEVLAGDLGASIGRPYGGGSFTVSRTDRVAFTWTRPDRPAEVAVWDPGGVRVLTDLNSDLLGQRQLAPVEAIEVSSGPEALPIQAWVVRPPGASQPAPAILEIHGGPFADYGDRFSAEIQLYAAAGYLVVYANPRGSTSYGAEFANRIHHAYPGRDYDDLMAVVDEVVARGWADPKRLFVTGGSGGGVLTSWIVGKTDRFRAAVVAKPVIDWTSFVLTSDAYPYFAKYWFPGPPWEHPEHYWARSPLSLVGNVTTPTMLLSGEQDHRTPISEAEQFYQALKLRGVESALVRVPGASHGIAARPSHLIAKVLYVLKWFERHGGPAGEAAPDLEESPR